MAFNSDFWVTVGTAAPVIALSAILVFNEQATVLTDRSESEKADFVMRVTAYQAATFLYFLNGLNAAIQGAMFFAALASLATRYAPIPEYGAAFIEAAGIILLLMSTYLTILTRIRFEGYKKQQLLSSKNRSAIKPYKVRLKTKPTRFRPPRRYKERLDHYT